MGAYPYHNKKESIYVLGFYFSKDRKQVVLIEKIKPEWQAGKLNGVGGKKEITDIDDNAAMEREFREETGIEHKDWEHYATYQGRDRRMEVFCGFGDVSQAKTTEKEKVVIVDVNNLPENVMRNIKFLIPLALQDDLNPTTFQEDDVGLSYINNYSNDEKEKERMLECETKRIQKERLRKKTRRGLA